MNHLFRNAQIASEDSTQLQHADILIENGIITAIDTHLPNPNHFPTTDCTGKIALPALFDLQVHAREPGHEAKETIASAAAAAINGGITGFVMMPNTNPAIDTAGLVKTVLESAAKTPLQLYTSGTITKAREGKELAAIGAMKNAGAVMITDDGSPVTNPIVLRRAMEYARDFNLIIASHCETPELTGKGSMHEGEVSYSLGLEGIPAISEEICIARDIQLAQYTGAHLHIQNATTANSIELIRRAKNDGIHVTCEVAPHYLIFNHHHIGDYNTNFKMNPPLRTAEDNAALLAALIDGTFDIIASDHAPHTQFDKNNDFVTAPFGISGLDTALVSLHHHYITNGKLTWQHIVKHYSANPRRLLGLPTIPICENTPANFILFDPTVTTTFSADFMQSLSQNTPFLDHDLLGKITTVFHNGNQLQ